MNVDIENPRLLLVASLCCTFSVVAVLSHFASQAPAVAAARGSAEPVVRPAIPVADEPATGVSRPGEQDPTEGPGQADADAPSQACTLNPHGPGLLPTVAPGCFVPAAGEATPATARAEPPADDPVAGLEERAKTRPFRMPKPRRPGSSGAR